MNPVVKKYFWSLNIRALKETERIFKDPAHPRFISKAIDLLSVCDQPREVFLAIPRDIFIDKWPSIKRRWRRSAGNIALLHWWDSIYDVIISGKEQIKPDQRSKHFQVIGEQIKKARLTKEWSQAELASRVGMAQRKISELERGKANITMGSLLKIVKILGINTMRFKEVTGYRVNSSP